MEVFNGKCRKHPCSSISNKQQQGICSVCLRNRLLQLADTYNHNTTFHSTPDGRRLSFSSTSTSSSPPPIYFPNHVRYASSSDVVRSISYVIGGRDELKKSRSITTTTMDVGRNSKRGGSFWKKLLKVRGGVNSSSSSVKDQVQVGAWYVQDV